MMDAFPLKMCRACEGLSHLIDISCPQKQYVEMFLACANVTFQLDDELPKYLCRLCASQLVYSYKFKQLCEKTQQKLQQRLAAQKREFFCEGNDSELQEIKPELCTDDNQCSEDQDDVDLSCVKTELFEPKDQNNGDKKPSKPSPKNAQLAANAKAIRFPSPKKPQPTANDKPIRLKCDMCKGKSYKAKAGLENHMRDKHGMARNWYQCEYCEEWFVRCKLPIHLFKHEKPFQCQLCSKQFSTVGNLQRHIKCYHDREKRFECLLCGKRFSQKVEMHIHAETVHSTERNYKCEHCSKTFKTKPYLITHLVTHFPDIRKPRMKGKGQVKAKTARQHRLKYNRQAVCQYCGKSVSVFSLGAHIETHNEHRPFRCDVCGKSFKTKLTHYAHGKTHTGKRDFKCDICGSAFLLKAHLKAHQSVHTGEKPFKCEHCGKDFALKVNYEVHRRLHTGEKPYACEHCTERFIDLNGLKRHRNKWHSI